jgi:cytochrome c553
MLREFIINPGHARWFGEASEMPASKGKYSDADMKELVGYLIMLRSTEPEANTEATPAQ